MFKRFGRLSLGALLAASVISHNPVAKAEMSAKETIQMIELKGNVQVTQSATDKAVGSVTSADRMTIKLR